MVFANSSLNLKIVVLFLIFLGEACAISAELYAAQRYSQKTHLLSIVVPSVILVIVAGMLLVAGYMLGFQSFKNIWIVSAISVTSILVIEPALNYSIFNQLPTKGAFIGLMFGIVGLIITLTSSK